MFKNCAIGQCKSRSLYVKDDTLHFYRFPSHSTDKERRENWARLCGKLTTKQERIGLRETLSKESTFVPFILALVSVFN